jgi:hypothetical protein
MHVGMGLQAHFIGKVIHDASRVMKFYKDQVTFACICLRCKFRNWTTSTVSFWNGK